MYLRVEPSGCCERKGKVQVRLCFYLDKKDIGYDKCRHLFPVGNPVYEGKTDEFRRPVDEADYQEWYDALEKELVDVPFHNHFIYVDAATTNKEILDIGEEFLKEAYSSWAKDEAITCKNPHTHFDNTPAKKVACANKANSLTAIERKL